MQSLRRPLLTGAEYKAPGAEADEDLLDEEFDELDEDGGAADDEDGEGEPNVVTRDELARISPLLHAHVIPSGTYHFERASGAREAQNPAEEPLP